MVAGLRTVSHEEAIRTASTLVSAFNCWVVMQIGFFKVIFLNFLNCEIGKLLKQKSDKLMGGPGGGGAPCLPGGAAPGHHQPPADRHRLLQQVTPGHPVGPGTGHVLGRGPRQR